MPLLTELGPFDTGVLQICRSEWSFFGAATPVLSKTEMRPGKQGQTFLLQIFDTNVTSWRRYPLGYAHEKSKSSDFPQRSLFNGLRVQLALPARRPFAIAAICCGAGSTGHNRTRVGTAAARGREPGRAPRSGYQASHKSNCHGAPGKWSRHFHTG